MNYLISWHLLFRPRKFFHIKINSNTRGQRRQRLITFTYIINILGIKMVHPTTLFAKSINPTMTCVSWHVTLGNYADVLPVSMQLKLLDSLLVENSNYQGYRRRFCLLVAAVYHNLDGRLRSRIALGLILIRVRLPTLLNPCIWDSFPTTSNATIMVFGKDLFHSWASWIQWGV